MINRNLLISVIALVVLPNRSTSDVPLNMDLVIVLHNGAQIWEDMFDMGIRPLTTILPTIFNFGDNKTRMALVWNKEGRWAVIANLSGDPKKFEEGINSFALPDPSNMDLNITGALSKIDNDVFANQPTRKPRVILIFSQDEMSTTPSMASAVPISKKLRDDGVVIFSIQHDRDRESVKEDFRQLVGDPVNAHQVFSINHNITPEFLEIVKTNLTKQFCDYAYTCYFVNPERCEKGPYLPKEKIHGVNVKDCKAAGAMPSNLSDDEHEHEHECDHTKCDKVCDDLWPALDVPKCTDHCDMIIVPARTGRKPHGEFAEWCSEDREPIECPPCQMATNGTTHGSKLPLPLVIGISAGAAAGLILVIVLIVVFVKRRKRANAELTDDEKVPIISKKKTIKKKRMDENIERDVSSGKSGTAGASMGSDEESDVVKIKLGSVKGKACKIKGRKGKLGISVKRLKSKSGKKGMLKSMKSKSKSKSKSTVRLGSPSMKKMISKKKGGKKSKM